MYYNLLDYKSSEAAFKIKLKSSGTSVGILSVSIRITCFAIKLIFIYV